MNNPIKILIAEHDYNDIELIRHELKKGDINYISEMVEDEQTYSRKSRAQIYDGGVEIITSLGNGCIMKVLFAKSR